MKKTSKGIILLLSLTLGIWMWKSRGVPHPKLLEGIPNSILTSPIWVSKQNHENSYIQTSVIVPSQNDIQSEKVETLRKLQILKEIFTSKNDNDPRLDQDLKELTPHTKQALEEKYNSLHTELRNERGTLVFLIGRNLNSKEDFDFFRKVVSEAPCLSLNDCTNSINTSDSSDDNNAVEITLNYPQIVALKSLKSYLIKNPSSPEAKSVLEEALKSKSRLVAQMASEIIKKL